MEECFIYFLFSSYLHLRSWSFKILEHFSPKRKPFDSGCDPNMSHIVQLILDIHFTFMSIRSSLVNVLALTEMCIRDPGRTNDWFQNPQSAEGLRYHHHCRRVSAKGSHIACHRWHWPASLIANSGVISANWGRLGCQGLLLRAWDLCVGRLLASLQPQISRSGENRAHFPRQILVGSWRDDASWNR